MGTEFNAHGPAPCWSVWEGLLRGLGQAAAAGALARLCLGFCGGARRGRRCVSVLLLVGSLVSAFRVRRGCGGPPCGSARVNKAFSCPMFDSFGRMENRTETGLQTRKAKQCT